MISIKKQIQSLFSKNRLIVQRKANNMMNLAQIQKNNFKNKKKMKRNKFNLIFSQKKINYCRYNKISKVNLKIEEKN